MDSGTIRLEEYVGPKTPITAFYKECGAPYEPQEYERIFVAMEDGDIIGAVRLCIEHDTYMLRTMQVRWDKRASGVGTKLLEYFASHLGRHECYCLPFKHLEHFYGRIGFKVIPENSAPTFLHVRLDKYRRMSDGKEYIVMMRTVKIQAN